MAKLTIGTRYTVVGMHRDHGGPVSLTLRPESEIGFSVSGAVSLSIPVEVFKSKNILMESVVELQITVKDSHVPAGR